MIQVTGTLSGKKNFKFIDLFAGMGGFRLALEKIGGNCVFSSEKDPFARKTYMHRFKDEPDKDITDFIDQLTGDQFEKISDFFNSMPKLRHVVKVTNPKTKKKSEVVLEGLQSFLV